VSQPRGPCANIARRWQRPELVKRVVETSRFGWYLRVLEEGPVAADMDVRLVERLYPDWNAAHVFRLRVEPRLDPDAVAGLARCPELTPTLREKFAAQLATLDGP
jgi:MOSC domain-containing protein YiiM